MMLPTHFTSVPNLLAQTDAGPPMAGAPAAPTTLAPGGTAPAPGQAAPRGGLDIVTVLMIGLLVAMILSIFLGGRREKKKFEQMMSAMKKHDQVRTVGGIIGSVVEIKPDVVVLKVDENSNTKITVARSKIEAVLKESTAGA